MQDKHNKKDKARAVVDKTEKRIITRDKNKRKSITFNNQTVIVVKREKDNEKKDCNLFRSKGNGV